VSAVRLEDIPPFPFVFVYNSLDVWHGIRIRIRFRIRISRIQIVPSLFVYLLDCLSVCLLVYLTSSPSCPAAVPPLEPPRSPIGSPSPPIFGLFCYGWPITAFHMHSVCLDVFRVFLLVLPLLLLLLLPPLLLQMLQNHSSHTHIEIVKTNSHQRR